MITITQTEAQKRAKKNYVKRHGIKQWKADIPPALNDAVEKKRREKGQTKKQVLETYLHHDTEKK